MTTYKVTLSDLILFKPENDREKEIYTINKDLIVEMMKNLNDNIYYLGGQIKMTHNDFIDLELINKVREIDRQRMIEFGGPSNSWELISINNHNKMLNDTEIMLKKYIEVMKMREIKSY
jgi:hypothetical protein